MPAMAGALLARHQLRPPPVLPIRVRLLSIWSSFWAENDPYSNTSTATCSNLSSSSSSAQSQHKKLTYRLSAVVDAVNERKLPPELRGRGNAIRSETDIVNVVEQRIWHSMEEGHFENLPGKGKPLNLNTNPHADPAEDTLYRILSRNGCAPEWVELNKEIRSNIAEWRSALKKAWTEKSDEEGHQWLQITENLKARMKDINGKVLRYNLMVPFGRQMFGLKWEKEMGRLNVKEGLV
ncbi:dnaJ homolog subfamily C member 28-like [Phalaenopsis equestris]|uniref:dnaJ homolog subfamily C member 28-like n=1 Tax=Phalaenopsis equestris TaxID=78828 RepID=UPI0009E19661|nr:dnaJ homolog subfamily C member 28-like [Phalaenopsis equestris]